MCWDCYFIKVFRRKDWEKPKLPDTVTHPDKELRCLDAGLAGSFTVDELANFGQCFGSSIAYIEDDLLVSSASFLPWSPHSMHLETQHWLHRSCGRCMCCRILSVECIIEVHASDQKCVACSFTRLRCHRAHLRQGVASCKRLTVRPTW